MATRNNTARVERRDGSVDAVTLLTADHKEVKRLFKSYDDLVGADAGAEEKDALAEQICSMLTIHATIEEEIFYPAAREILEEQDLLDEAEVEHASAEDLIAQIQDMQPEEDLFDAKVKVLGEYIAHHVKEEEEELFPKVKRSKLDLQALGGEMSSRKQQLLSEAAIEAWSAAKTSSPSEAVQLVAARFNTLKEYPVQDSTTMQAPLQPFIKLVQSNVALLTQFSMSPEVISQARANAQSVFQREPGAVNNFAQSNAFGQLMQGMFKNYTEFVGELGQSGMTLLAHGQAAMLQNAEDASSSEAAGSEARGRRSR